jgi:cytochrome c-type biogenesis protein CcmH/NrfG
MRHGRIDLIYAASVVSPFERLMREGPAHVSMLSRAPEVIAIPAIERALASNPHSADLLWALSQYRTQANDEKGALEAFARFRAIVPTHVLAKTVIGSLAFPEGARSP